MLWLIVPSVFVLGFLFWKVVFLRNPERTIPKGNDLVAPADGKVISVLPYTNNAVTLYKGNHRLLGTIRTMTNDVSESGTIISIFMSPLNVHYNRAPLSGSIVSVKHIPGKFLPVNTLEHGLENEKTEIIIAHSDTKIKVIQIAGFLAKRIETFVKPGDSATKGSVIGLINLGSQVTVVLPTSLSPAVAVGQKIKAGETILATINS